MERRRRRAIAARLTRCSVACAALLLLSACGDDGNGGPTTTVNVTQREFIITLDSASAPAARVKFHVSNVGVDMHEFLVIKTDLAPDALPTEDNGSYKENEPGTELLDEIPLVQSGHSANLTLNLKKGNYVLICNMVHDEDGNVEVHYQLGMRTAFTVS